MAPLSITRSTRLAAAPATVWEAMATGEGLARWLGSAPPLAADADADADADAAADADADADPRPAPRTPLVPGTPAVVADADGTVRRLVVTEVDQGRRLGFTWWDDGRPADVSTVVIEVEPEVDGDGAGARVTVTESLGTDPTPATGGSGARAAAVSAGGLDAAARWDARLAHLLGAAATELVAVGA